MGNFNLSYQDVDACTICIYFGTGIFASLCQAHSSITKGCTHFSVLSSEMAIIRNKRRKAIRCFTFLWQDSVCLDQDQGFALRKICRGRNSHYTLSSILLKFEIVGLKDGHPLVKSVTRLTQTPDVDINLVMKWRQSWYIPYTHPSMPTTVPQYLQ